jgi:hypothetical protein
MKQILIVLCLLMPLSAFCQCLTDYRVNQSWQPHHLSRQHLEIVNRLARSGQPGNGWHYLASLGDTYASLAAIVLNPVPGTPDVLFHQYIHRHWENVVGPVKTATHFMSFAKVHFKQYVSVLNSGTWPDADQILNSYLASARKHSLPQLVVFGAAWTASDFSNIVSWQVLNMLPSDRMIGNSRICLTITREEANQIIKRDLGF